MLPPQSRPGAPLTRADILTLQEYEAAREERRIAIGAVKRWRRLAVGPFAMLHFENFATLWLQVQEMLRIEKGGEAQISHELAAYAPLVPNGRELVATLMLEIDQPERRRVLLAGLGGIDRSVSIRFGNETISGIPEADQERTTPDGKTAAVHFLRFAFTPAQITAFRHGTASVLAVIDHPNYGHIAIVPEVTRYALADDFA